MLRMFSALFVAPLDSSTSTTPNIDIPRLEAEVEIDGVLDELVWGRAIVLDGFSQYLPVDGPPECLREGHVANRSESHKCATAI